MRHDQPLKAWIIQRNRRKRQNSSSPVIFALLGNLDTNVSPSFVAQPDINIEGGSDYSNFSWSSSDTSVIDFNYDTGATRFNLLKPGTATVTLTITNSDGSIYVTSKIYNIV